MKQQQADAEEPHREVRAPFERGAVSTLVSDEIIEFLNSHVLRARPQ